MAFDSFIKIDGVSGESGDKQHPGWIEVLSVNWGLSKPYDQSGQPSRSANFSNFTFTKVLDASSPLLFQACALGQDIKEIILETCRAGEDKTKYMVYNFGTCHITNIDLSSSGDSKESLPVETVSFNYQTLVVTYTQQKRRDGIPGGKIEASFNLRSLRDA